MLIDYHYIRLLLHICIEKIIKYTFGCCNENVDDFVHGVQHGEVFEDMRQRNFKDITPSTKPK